MVFIICLMLKFMSYKNYIQACTRGYDVGLLEASLEFPVSKESEEEFPLVTARTRFSVQSERLNE